MSAIDSHPPVVAAATLLVDSQAKLDSPVVPTHEEAEQCRAKDKEEAVSTGDTLNGQTSAEAATIQQSTNDDAAVKDTVATTEDTIKEETAPLEPIFSANLSYKRSTATFPVFHTRHFWLQDEPISLEKLQALYLKMQKTKMPASEAHDLIAHAVTSGKGLLFWGKTEGSNPSGILDISQISELEVVDGNNRAAFKYRDDISYTLEFNANAKVSQRQAFLLGIKQKQQEFVGQMQSIRTSEVFNKVRELLVQGTAFEKSNAEVEEQVLSDEEVVEQRPDNRRASSLMGIFKNKPEDAKEVPTPKKDKRASFLGFLNKKDNTLPESVPAGADKSVSPKAPEGESEPVSADNEVDKDVPTADRADKSRPAALPAKDKVEGFFRNLIKRNDKSDEGQKVDAVAPESVVTDAPAPQVAEGEISPVKPATDVAAPLAHDATAAESTSKDKLTSATPPPVTPSPNPSPKPFPGGSVTRRLTGLFKNKSKKDASKTDSVVSPTKDVPVASEAPLLPQVGQETEALSNTELSSTTKLDRNKDLPAEGIAIEETSAVAPSDVVDKGKATEMTAVDSATAAQPDEALQTTTGATGTAPTKAE
ncbi:hypothetical protein BCR37DRAFT_390850 [Protomyces lactucae-debilis]|uniref:Meiotic expression up-regulated protein 6 PH domain-containing protein n=1 Tax=Protomyces lactucae-debilis TaxID=2754530 RepID=A0A1Y2FUA5_PROLT|nr:uncharacterized protein BCR37DRAFT_390850 [Protomyces lactucae-debilis]ORY87147.1 hypothetical protein BCR37DRAFT_390850 [Protomyces lactucae-debilis]